MRHWLRYLSNERGAIIQSGAASNEMEVLDKAARVRLSDTLGDVKADLTHQHIQAERGQVCVAINPTMGTGIAMGIQTTFSDTANVLSIIQNTNTTRQVILSHMRLICTVAGASTTSSHLALAIDTGARFSSGGTALSPVRTSSAFISGGADGVSVWFGALTAFAASGSRRIVSRAVLKTQAAPCWTVGDEVLVTFGWHYGGSLKSGAGPATFTVAAPSVILGNAAAGTQTFLAHMWNPANATTAPSWEVEIAYYLR